MHAHEACVYQLDQNYPRPPHGRVGDCVQPLKEHLRSRPVAIQSSLSPEKAQLDFVSAACFYSIEPTNLRETSTAQRVITASAG